MTNQEAIDVLRNHYRNAAMAGSPEEALKNNMAIDMAITAVRNSPDTDILAYFTRDNAKKMISYAEKINTSQVFRVKDVEDPNWEMIYGVRKKAHHEKASWKFDEDTGRLYCSHCGGEALYTDNLTEVDSHFCPHCGSVMEGVK